jgi:hypothetical protein
LSVRIFFGIRIRESSNESGFTLKASWLSSFSVLQQKTCKTYKPMYQCKKFNYETWYNCAWEKKTPGIIPPANYTDRRLSAKLVPALADRRCSVVSATNPHGR